MKNFYVILINTTDGLFLLAQDKDMVIQAFKTKKEALEYFEDGYNQSHKRGYEASMSACINNITFRPSVIKVSDLDDIRNNIVGKKPRGFHLYNVSGMIYALSTIPEAKKLWESGDEPKLISERTFP